MIHVKRALADNNRTREDDESAKDTMILFEDFFDKKYHQYIKSGVMPTAIGLRKFITKSLFETVNEIDNHLSRELLPLEPPDVRSLTVEFRLKIAHMFPEYSKAQQALCPHYFEQSFEKIRCCSCNKIIFLFVEKEKGRFVLNPDLRGVPFKRNDKRRFFFEKN